MAITTFTLLATATRVAAHGDLFEEGKREVKGKISKDKKQITNKKQNSN
jgi:hypothetical protein